MDLQQELDSHKLALNNLNAEKIAIDQMYTEAIKSDHKNRVIILTKDHLIAQKDKEIAALKDELAKMKLPQPVEAEISLEAIC